MAAPQPELEALIDEVRLLWNTLVRRGETLHRREALTMGMRAVLEFIARNGPTPVPAIARRRGVSRQHVQALVNPLLERDLVEATANPAHRRSPRIRLTAKGERTIGRMRRREAAVLSEIRLGAGELRRAAATLRAVTHVGRGSPHRGCRAAAAPARWHRASGCGRRDSTRRGPWPRPRASHARPDRP